MFTQELAQIAIFENLSREQLILLQPYIDTCSFPKDQVIFEQGDPAHFLYIVLKGEVLVRYKAYDGPVIPVARVGPGGVFGWSAALGRPTYTSGAACSADTDTLRFTGKALHHLCDEHPDTGIVVLERLAGVIADRLSSTHAQILSILTRGVEGDSECLRRYGTHDRE